VSKRATLGDYKDVDRAKAWLAHELGIHGGEAKVDRVGVGAGAIPDDTGQGWSAYGIHWGMSARDSRRFLNRKAEDYWDLRTGLEDGTLAIAPLGDCEDELMEDLAGTYWEVTTADKIRIEDKAKTRERLKRSPNCGDAAVLGIAKPAIVPQNRRRYGTVSGQNW
jgi:hypothetical protein